jgi:putative membrane protein
MQKQIPRFFLRWLANFIGIWLISVMGLISNNSSILGWVLGALLLGILNGLLKPLLIILTLPAIALTLGFFLIIINGLIFYIAGKLYSPLGTDSFWAAILAGIVIGLVNYIITILLEVNSSKDG